MPDDDPHEPDLDVVFVRSETVVAREIAGDVRAVALSLLGAPWVAENLAAADALSANERTRP